MKHALRRKALNASVKSFGLGQPVQVAQVDLDRNFSLSNNFCMSSDSLLYESVSFLAKFFVFF